MPIYEYRCQECQQTFEEWQKDFTERQVPCPVCGAKSERIMSNTSFVLKGGGWYSDLYSKPAQSKAEPAQTESSTAPAACSTSCSGGGCSN